MPRATKIVATLGPACSSPEVLARLLAAGGDVVLLTKLDGAETEKIARREGV